MSMYQKTVLENGLRIVTSSMPHTRSVCICFFIGTGSRYEASEQAGISHFIEHLCFKGTERRPTAKEISETIDGVGGMLNGGTDKELTVYWSKVARPHFALSLDLLVDMLRNSRFESSDIEMERKVIIEELNMCFDSPQSRVDTLIDEVMWPDQPLGRDVLGHKETISGVNRTEIVNSLLKRYLPSNTVIGVAGDISHDEVSEAVTKALGTWKDDVPASWSPAKYRKDSRRIITEHRKTEQAHLCLSVKGIPHNHPDRFTLDLLNLILGEGMSSRLFLEIREKLGLAYDVHSHISHYHDSGSVSVCAGVDHKQIEKVIAAILLELVKLKDEIVTETEISKAKELGKGRLMLRIEDTRSVAGWIGGQDLLMGHIRTVDEVVSLLDAVTAADLQRVARDIFREEKLRLALVAPRPNEDRLEKLLKL